MSEVGHFGVPQSARLQWGPMQLSVKIVNISQAMHHFPSKHLVS